MPRQQTLLFAMKLLAVAEEAHGQLTIEEICEAFINISETLSKKIETARATQQLAERVMARAKQDPNLVN